MSSPIGHSLIGGSFYYLFNHGLGIKKKWNQLAFYIFASIAPDLDLIPGIFIGAANKYHHGATHSLGAALLFGLFMAVIFKWKKNTSFHIAFLIFFSLYFVHVLIDAAAVDLRPPSGVELLWPFSSKYFIAPIRIFPPVHKKSIMDLVSFDNFVTGAIELGIFLPILFLSYWYRVRNLNNKNADILHLIPTIKIQKNK
jgi:inner membrane protein